MMKEIVVIHRVLSVLTYDTGVDVFCWFFNQFLYKKKTKQQKMYLMFRECVGSPVSMTVDWRSL